MKETSRTDFWKIELEKPVFFTVAFYLGAVAVIEILGYYTSPIMSAVGNALLIFFAINQAVWMRNTACYRILPAIALISFARLLGVIVPIHRFPLQINYVLVTVPLLVTVGLMAYYRKIPLAEFGLRRSGWRSQLPIALSGIPLGFIGFLLLRPVPLFVGSGPVFWIASLLIVFICIAFAEEIVFRGVFLYFIAETGERFALLSSGVLYGILNIGSHSLIYALFMGMVGGVFAFFARRTRSIWGIVVAHFLLVAGMGLFWPFFLIHN